MPDLTELDRLIEEGLNLYGHGDLDGALLVWEKALAMDPENAQANSYVDYVRSNYDMLTSDSAETADVPFGIGEDEPEYHIEIAPGDIKPGGAPILGVNGVGEADLRTGRENALAGDARPFKRRPHFPDQAVGLFVALDALDGCGRASRRIDQRHAARIGASRPESGVPA